MAKSEKWKFNSRQYREGFKKVLKTKVKIIGAGRTDKGVHALSQFANFQLKKKIEDKKAFINSINFFLKKKLITILDIKEEKKISMHVLALNFVLMNI